MHIYHNLSLKCRQASQENPAVTILVQGQGSEFHIVGFDNERVIFFPSSANILNDVHLDRFLLFFLSFLFGQYFFPKMWGYFIHFYVLKSLIIFNLFLCDFRKPATWYWQEITNWRVTFLAIIPCYRLRHSSLESPITCAGSGQLDLLIWHHGTCLAQGQTAKIGYEIQPCVLAPSSVYCLLMFPP